MWRKYLKSKKVLVTEINLLKHQLAELENSIVERESKKWLAEKMKMISDHKGEVIKYSEQAADDRELAILPIIEKKDARIRDLELEIIDIRNTHRNFSETVCDHEKVIIKFTSDIGAAAIVLQQLSGKFEGISDEIRSLSRKVEKGNKKLIEEGKA